MIATLQEAEREVGWKTLQEAAREARRKAVWETPCQIACETVYRNLK